MQRSSVFSFLTLSKPTAQCPRLHLGQAAAELFCSHTHFHVTLTCQCAQNCQTLLKALDAMCNSFNTRPCRYPYHCSNGVLMPPCIPRACTRQLVIHLIYSTSTRSGPCRVDGQNTRPDTWQPSSFRGDLRVMCDSITGQKNIIHGFLSAAKDWFYFMRNKWGRTWRREKSW